MGSIKLVFLFMMVIIGFFLTFQIEPNRNKILFDNDVGEVADSLTRMELLLKKFPKTYMVNYFVDNEGYLYLNNQKIAPLKGAIDDPKVRRDMVFETFKNEEIDEFFYLMAYLWKNNVHSSHKEPTLGKFVFSYGNQDVRNNKDVRLLMAVGNSSDTSSTNFKKWFRVVDKRGNLALLAPQ